jgi:hypothetical protein
MMKVAEEKEKLLRVEAPGSTMQGVARDQEAWLPWYSGGKKFPFRVEAQRAFLENATPHL